MKKEALLKTKTDKKQFLKWIDALKSGKYSQTTGTLQNEKGYCCLGVACRILIPKNKLRTSDINRLRGTMPKEQPNSPKWLVSINNDYFSSSRASLFLTDLNDDKKNTFKEIANKLMRVYKKELDAIK